MTSVAKSAQQNVSYRIEWQASCYRTRVQNQTLVRNVLRAVPAVCRPARETLDVANLAHCWLAGDAVGATLSRITLAQTQSLASGKKPESVNCTQF